MATFSKNRRKNGEKKKKNSVNLKVGDHKMTNIRWEDLADEANKLTKDAIYYIQTVQTIRETNKDIIDGNEKLSLLISGFSKSIKDLADQIVATRQEHLTLGDNGFESVNKGVVGNNPDLDEKTNNDAVYKYFNLANKYVSYRSTLNNLVNHLFMDIMASIRTEANKEVIDKFVSDTEYVTRVMEEHSKTVSEMTEMLSKPAPTNDGTFDVTTEGK